MPISEIPDLDPVVHAPLRLAVLTILSTLEHADFNYLKEMTKATDGNLNAHLIKLEKTGYVKSRQKIVGRKARTFYRMTAPGREALLGYVRDLKKLLAVNPALSMQ